MAYSNIPQHQQVTTYESNITAIQTEGAVMAQSQSEWLIIAVLDNIIVAAPLSPEKPGDEWKVKYSVKDKHGKYVILYKVETFGSDHVPTGHQYITGDGIDKEARNGVEKVLRSMFLKKNDNVDTEFRYCMQYNTTDGELVIVISSCEFNHHMENIIVLKREDGQLIPRLIHKSLLVPGGERVPTDQRRSVAAAACRILKGIPNADLVPLPVLADKIDKTQRKMFEDEASYVEGSEPTKDSEGSSSDDEASYPTVAGPSSAREAACQSPVDNSNELSVCTASVPYRPSAEIMGVTLTMVYRHIRTGCDRSNVMCRMCMAPIGMFMHVLMCKCDYCPQKQLIVQGFVQHVHAGHCKNSPCSIPFCRELGVLVREEDRRYPSAHLTTCFLHAIMKTLFNP